MLNVDIGRCAYSKILLPPEHTRPGCDILIALSEGLRRANASFSSFEHFSSKYQNVAMPAMEEYVKEVRNIVNQDNCIIDSAYNHSASARKYDSVLSK